MSLEFVGIHHAYGDRRVLSGVDLTASAGEITCLLGPSGCGKTTLLRLAAGLVNVQDGAINLDGQLLADGDTHSPPEARPVGLVFQEGALFPHMTVAQNIGFGVSQPAPRTKKIAELLKQIGLEGLDGSYPHHLSGGQQQRVALARALAPEPRVLLLDEPFASVDVVLRRAIREETRRVLKARDAVAILVTHDPDEAMEIGDRIAVMSGGRIVQAGTPQDLYDEPKTSAVATMFGNGQSVRARRTSTGVETPFGLWPTDALRMSPNALELDLVVRPEQLRIHEGGDMSVEDVRRLGEMQRIAIAAPSGRTPDCSCPARSQYPDRPTRRRGTEITRNLCVPRRSLRSRLASKLRN